VGFEVNENQHCNAIYTMKIEKQQDKLAQMDQLIRTEATGSTEKFAAKLRLAKSTMYEYLNYMKDLGAEIIFDRQRNCFKYKRPCKLQLIKIESLMTKILKRSKVEKSLINFPGSIFSNQLILHLPRD